MRVIYLVNWSLYLNLSIAQNIHNEESGMNVPIIWQIFINFNEILWVFCLDFFYTVICKYKTDTLFNASVDGIGQIEN